MALGAVVGDVHGPHIAENLIASLGLVAPYLVGVLIRQKRLDGGGLVGVRGIVDVARVQVREADGVIRLLGEQRRHRLPRNGAMQSLVVVLPVGGIVDDVLVQRDEIPHGIHLGNEHPRLLQKIGLGAARLIVIGERKEHRRYQHENNREKPDKLRPQPDLPLSPKNRHGSIAPASRQRAAGSPSSPCTLPNARCGW